MKVALLVSVTLILAGCGATVEDMKEKTVPYRGRTLYCMATGETENAALVSCDFVRFYHENPDLIPKSLPQ